MVLNESPDRFAVSGHDELPVSVDDVVALSTTKVVLMSGGGGGEEEEEDRVSAGRVGACGWVAGGEGRGAGGGGKIGTSQARIDAIDVQRIALEGGKALVCVAHVRYGIKSGCGCQGDALGVTPTQCMNIYAAAAAAAVYQAALVCFRCAACTCAVCCMLRVCHVY